MKNDLAPVIFFGAALTLVAIGALVCSAAPSMCAFPGALGETARGGWCLEFWLNRYQTLLGGIFTLVGAAIAAAFVVGQTRVARQQLDVMLGDIEPDFILRRSQGVHGFDLVVSNQNRRPLLLKKIALVTPINAHLVLDASSAFRRYSYDGESGGLTLDGVVGGTRPAAAQVTSVEMTGWISVKQRSGNVIGASIEMTLQIDFEIMGSNRERTVLVSASDVKIGGSHWSNENAVSSTVSSR